MSSKRALTGGTGDVNPQWLRFEVTESAANTFTQAEIQIPVMRVGFQQNRAQVIEILAIEIQVPGGSELDGDGTAFQITTGSKAATADFTDSDVLYLYRDIVSFTTSGQTRFDRIKFTNYTDGAGHGPIVATASIFVAVAGASQAAALTFFGRILYRFKNISLSEFVGISISQT